jgi:hypothetical protein
MSRLGSAVATARRGRGAGRQCTYRLNNLPLLVQDALAPFGQAAVEVVGGEGEADGAYTHRERGLLRPAAAQGMPKRPHLGQPLSRLLLHPVAVLQLRLGSFCYVSLLARRIARVDRSKFAMCVCLSI